MITGAGGFGTTQLIVIGLLSGGGFTAAAKNPKIMTITIPARKLPNWSLEHKWTSSLRVGETFLLTELCRFPVMNNRAPISQTTENVSTTQDASAKSEEYTSELQSLR